MKIKANINNPVGSDAIAIIKPFNTEIDVFKYLSEEEKRLIAKDYNLTRIIKVSTPILEKLVPKDIQMIQTLKTNFEQMPVNFKKQKINRKDANV